MKLKKFRVAISFELDIYGVVKYSIIRRFEKPFDASLVLSVYAKDESHALILARNLCISFLDKSKETDTGTDTVLPAPDPKLRSYHPYDMEK